MHAQPDRVARLGAASTSTRSPAQAAIATGVSTAACLEYLSGLDYGLSYEHLAGLTEFFRGSSRLAGCRTGRWRSCPPRDAPRAAPLAAPSGDSPCMISSTSTRTRRSSSSAPRPTAFAQRSIPHDIVTYIVDRNINYTNVCVADCGFCAFYRRPKHAEGWTLSFEQIGAKIDEAKALGGVQILMQGGHNPYIPFEWYLDLLRYIKTQPPDPHPRASARAKWTSSRSCSAWTRVDVIRELQKAGLDSIPGGGGEILVQRVRDIVAQEEGRRRPLARDHGDRASTRG